MESIEQKLKIAIDKVKELNDMGLKACIGGSLALYLHGIIDREPDDIDMVIDVGGKRDKFLEDIEFVGYKNFTFVFKLPVKTLDSKLVEVITTNPNQSFGSIDSLVKKVIQFKLGIPDFADYDSEYIGHNHKEGIKIDYLVSRKAIYHSYLYNGIEIPLCTVDTIMEARLRYGFVHKRFKETLEIVSKPMNSKLSLAPFELPF